MNPSPIQDDPPTADVLDGTPFRTVRSLGKGGMGIVLEAAHRELGKHFVVKLLLSEFESDDRHVKRLRLEARSLAKLDSPHVVGVSDLGQTPSGATYIAMELLQGRNLRAELAARPGGVIPVSEAITWARQMLAGLGAAHKLKIIHRDVKLDNLFVCDATESLPRRIKVLDFGIAKSLEDAAQTAQPQTQDGVFLGTPRYVSPEQAMCKPIDARSDIYSAGLVLYQMVAGKGPFAHHRSPMDLLTAQLGEEPQPPSSLAAQPFPPGLDAVILKAIAKDPADRYQTTEEFASALESLDAHGARPASIGARPEAPAAATPSDATMEGVTLQLPPRLIHFSPPTPAAPVPPAASWPAPLVARVEEPSSSITEPLPIKPTESPTIVSPTRPIASVRPPPDIDLKRFVALVVVAALASLALFSLLLHFYAAPR